MSKREDVLNREEFENNVINLIENLSNDKKGCMFAIDGKWGVGKSFVLEDIEDKLEKVQCEKTNSDKYLVFHYNCWQYDYYEEPAVAIVSAMLDKANERITAKLGKSSKAAWKRVSVKLKKEAGKFIKNKIGINLVEIADDIINNKNEIDEEEYSFDELFAFKKTLDSTRSTLAEISQDKTVVIVVDELDRCIPNYAIKVLERLHHFFEGIENVIVVFAIDSNQLNHSIEEMFGQGTDTEKYLKKFMSFKLKLEYGEPQYNIWDKYNNLFNMYESKYFSADDIELVKGIFFELFKHTRVDIREKEKIIEKIITIHSLIGKEKYDYSVMLYELMVCFFIAEQQKYANAKRKKIEDTQYDLQFLANIKTSHHVDIIDNYYIEILKKIENKSKYKYIDNALEYNKTFCLCENVIALTFLYLQELYLDEESKYADSERRKYSEELTFCRKFDGYRKIIQ